MLLIALTMAAFIFPRSARGADTPKHEIKLNEHVGDRWDLDVTQELSTKADVTVAGQASAVEQSVSSRRKATLEVLEVQDGQPTILKVTFDPACVTSVKNGGESIDQPFPLAGKTVMVRRDGPGKVSMDIEGIDADTAQEVGRLLEPDTSLCPPRPVSVGDEWQADTAVLGKQFQLGPGDQISLKCKLQAIGKVGGRATADIFTAGAISKNEQGILTHFDLSGVTRIDLATGQTLQATVIGKIGIKGSRDVQGANGQPVTVQKTGEGKFELNQTQRPADAAAQTDNVPHAGSDFPASEPAGHEDVERFAGTFADDVLTAEFHPTPDGLAGTLALHDRKLPASAHFEAGKLVGTFESDGNKFGFTASFDGNVMKLKSGSKIYTLEKRAENPLDAGAGERAKPGNPLDLQGP